MTRRQRGQDRRGKRRRKREPDDVAFDFSDDAAEPGFEDEYAFEGGADYIPEDGLDSFDDVDPYDLPRSR